MMVIGGESVRPQAEPRGMGVRPQARVLDLNLISGLQNGSLKSIPK